MPRISVKTHPREARHMLPLIPHETIPGALVATGLACGFDTDEKWIEMHVLDRQPEMIDGVLRCRMKRDANGNPMTQKHYIDFDIVDKITHKTLYSVRQ